MQKEHSEKDETGGAAADTVLRIFNMRMLSLKERIQNRDYSHCEQDWKVCEICLRFWMQSEHESNANTDKVSSKMVQKADEDQKEKESSYDQTSQITDGSSFHDLTIHFFDSIRL